MELAMDEFRGNFEKPFRKLADTEESSVNIANEIAEVVTKKLDGDVLPTMLKIITVDQSRRFIKKIFRKDEKKYIRFIRLIDRIPYWKAAYSTTIKLFRKLRVSRYSKEALELSNLIYLRYFPRDSYHNIIERKK